MILIGPVAAIAGGVLPGPTAASACPVCLRLRFQSRRVIAYSGPAAITYDTPERAKMGAPFKGSRGRAGGKGEGETHADTTDNEYTGPDKRGRRGRAASDDCLSRGHFPDRRACTLQRARGAGPHACAADQQGQAYVHPHHNAHGHHGCAAAASTGRGERQRAHDAPGAEPAAGGARLCARAEPGVGQCGGRRDGLPREHVAAAHPLHGEPGPPVRRLAAAAGRGRDCACGATSQESRRAAGARPCAAYR